MNTVQCLIQQANCGLTAQDPVCAKCGIDTRVRYVSEEAALLAKAQAEARYWKSEALGNTGRRIEIRVPDIGDFVDVPVVSVLVHAGDTIGAEQSLIEVENDKASMEIPSSHGGVVKEVRVKCGDKVSEGSVILVLECEGL